MLTKAILACRKCPRLAAYHAGIKTDHPDWHCAPVPGFGDPDARVALIGLAPSKTGGNRTSRIFTGDKTAEFLYAALHAEGLSNLARSERADDGLRLKSLFLTPAVKCAPPQDKPTPEEIRNCAPFLSAELSSLKKLRVVLAMGKIAHDAYLRFRGQRLAAFPFAHGAVHDLGGSPLLVDTYHCSPRNTNTGLLSRKMLRDVLRKVVRLSS